MIEYILIGDSGHAKVIEDCIIANSNKVIAKLDDKYSSIFKEGPYIKGPLSCIKSLLKNNTKVVVAIGNNQIRKKIVGLLNIKIDYYGTVIHPSAIISPSASIQAGTVIMPNVVVNADCQIGGHVILNSTCVVEHDCVVENFAHISPGTILTGGVTVGEGTQLGAKSTVIPLIKIGDWSMVGAGSVVIKNIDDRITAAGVPARVIKKEGTISGK